MNIQSYLDAVKAVYEANKADNPHRLRMRHPAKRRLLAQVEKTIGTPLNAELRTLWEQFDGSGGAPFFHDERYLFSYEFLSVSESLDHRSCFEKRAPQYDGTFECTEPRDVRVGDGWFSSGWLPFAAEYDHAVLLVDHRPLGTGIPGQVIRYVHDPDRIEFVCDSVAELLPVSIKAIRADPLEFLGIY